MFTEYRYHIQLLKTTTFKFKNSNTMNILEYHEPPTTTLWVKRVLKSFCALFYLFISCTAAMWNWFYHRQQNYHWLVSNRSLLHHSHLRELLHPLPSFSCITCPLSFGCCVQEAGEGAADPLKHLKHPWNN